MEKSAFREQVAAMSTWWTGNDTEQFLSDMAKNDPVLADKLRRYIALAGEMRAHIKAKIEK